jgi:hypothetical protein
MVWPAVAVPAMAGRQGGEQMAGRINDNGIAAKRQKRLKNSPDITATDCDAVRRPAEGWQKNKPGKKMGFPRFFCHSMFLPPLTS